MLTEQKIVDRIEIVENVIQVRERISILRDGEEIASSFHRFIVKKDNDRSILDPQIKKIADALWGEILTPEST